MPTRFWILRLVVALLCLGFAFFWGRSVGGRQVSKQRSTGPAAWGIRTTVAGSALLWGAGPDLFAIASYVLAAACWGGGFFLGRMLKEPEKDLTKEIFPED